MGAKAIIRRLELMRNERNRAGMARYGINVEKAHGISIYELRKIAKEIGRDHERAQELWRSGIHEARHLAVYTEEPGKVTEAQLGSWVKDFDSWDLCDQACTDLFDQTPFAWKKAIEWSAREEEFVKRAAFSLIAGLAVHDMKAGDDRFKELLKVIVSCSEDERNFVRKAVNWALRNIGKRNAKLNKEAIRVAKQLKESKNKTARWIGSDALRELESEKVQLRLARL